VEIRSHVAAIDGVPVNKTREMELGFWTVQSEAKKGK
jgi:hypothetical protein